MLECLADSISGGERRFARQHTNDAASLGAEMIGYVRSRIMRSTLEKGTIGPSVLEYVFGGCLH